MYTRDLKSFSVKVKVPWWILSDYPDELYKTFVRKINGYLTKEHTISARIYKRASKCRFTVAFTEAQREPEVIDALVERIAKRTVPLIITEKTNNTLC